MSEPAIEETLEEYGAMTRDLMAHYLPTPEADHYLYGPAADYPLRGGKMMRPSICIATARLFGASLEDALKVAVSIELLHNALLIHDDIEDESETRRGQPTLHMKHGIPIALNVGDALALSSLRPLIHVFPRIGPWMGLKLIEDMERMARETAEGQAMELAWRHDNTLRLAPEDYLVMVLKKTCWLATIFPCRAGALLGTRSSIAEDAFMRFGFFVGAAFQISDDTLNIEAEAIYGKEACGDLLEGKRTLMLIDLLNLLRGDDLLRLVAFLSRKRSELAEDETGWVREKIIDLGCLNRARSAARGMAGAAQHEFDLTFGHFPQSRDKAFLSGLACWSLSRSH